MTLAARALAAVAVVLVVGVGALRWRKLRRDERRRASRSIDRRLLRPPPSPYAPSQGFKLLDGAAPLGRPAPERPRLDPDHEYVFSDSPGEDRPGAPGRHDTRWALERASRGTGLSSGARALLVLVSAAVLVGAVGYALRRPHHPHGSAATTTTSAPATTTTNWPAAFRPVGGAAGRTYDVPAASYELTIGATGAGVSATVRSEPSGALDYRGALAAGAAKSLVVTGTARLTLSDPGAAAVTVGGSPVTLPAPAPSPVTLTFTPTG